MIAKIISKGSGFKGCLSYLMEKEGAEVLESRGVRTENPGLAAKDFKMVSKQNEAVKKPVMHMSVSFYKNDRGKISDDIMRYIARKVIEEMGFGGSQYIVIKHTDQPHPHFHIVANRVSLSGKTVSDKKDYKRLHTIAKAIEQQYPFLTPAITKNPENIRTERLRPNDRYKLELYKYITNAAGKAKDINGLIKQLKKYGIQTELKYKRGSITEVQGIKFLYKDRWITGSKVHRSCSYGNLVKTIRVKNQTRASQPGAKFTTADAVKREIARQGQVVNDTVHTDMYETPQQKFRHRM